MTNTTPDGIPLDPATRELRPPLFEHPSNSCEAVAGALEAEFGGILGGSEETWLACAQGVLDKLADMKYTVV